jgi:2-pyrone-4,6-dicarboxylate lactonase
MARDPARQLRICYPPDPNPKTPAFKTPPGTCDTHFHVFGPPEKFPYSDQRVYTPPAAPFEHYMAMAGIVGIHRGVVVTPMAHGTDNSATLDAVARSGGKLLGMAKIDDSFSDKDLRELHEKGIRGVRFNLIEESGGAVNLPLFERIAARINDLGWCMCFHVKPDEMMDHFDWFGTLPTKVIIDHICRIEYEHGTSQKAFRRLLDLMKNEKMWLKISGADRQKSRGFPMEDVIPYTVALAEAVPDRLIWGTDWPHGNIFKPNAIPNDGDLIDILPKLVPDAAVLKKILVDNPARLFGFPPA